MMQKIFIVTSEIEMLLAIRLLIGVNGFNRIYQTWMDIFNGNTGCAGSNNVVWKSHIFLKVILAQISLAIFLP